MTTNMFSWRNKININLIPLVSTAMKRYIQNSIFLILSKKLLLSIRRISVIIGDRLNKMCGRILK